MNKLQIRLAAVGLATAVTLGGAVATTLLLEASTDAHLQEAQQRTPELEAARDVCKTHRCSHTVSPEGMTFTVYRNR